MLSGAAAPLAHLNYASSSLLLMQCQALRVFLPYFTLSGSPSHHKDADLDFRMNLP